jgi:hypothetical protein
MCSSARSVSVGGDSVKVSARAREALRGPVRTSVRRWQHDRQPTWLGTRPGLPDFVGIGVQRSGTSWWHSLLQDHPQVASLGFGAKELHLFDDAWRADQRPAMTTDWLSAHFRRGAGQIAGEWTPRYMYDVWAVPALVRLAPEVKLLVMLRDPLARLRSGVQHSLRRAEPSADLVDDAVSRGLYGAQLARVLEHVPREQLLVLQLERCQREQAAELRRTFEFLGLDPHTPDGQGERNAARGPVVELSSDLLDAAEQAYRADVEVLTRLLPGAIDLDLWFRSR